MVDLPCRYYRNYVEPGMVNSESNLEYAEQELPIERDQTALVLVDCWDLDHLGGPRFLRGNPIMDDRIQPVLEVARDIDLMTVHCPGPSVAENYAMWEGTDDEAGTKQSGTIAESEPDWPSETFRERSDEYAAFSKQADDAAREERWGEKYRPKDSIYGPLEPEDRDMEYVVGNGDRLHALLKEHGVLHLLYVGFNSNFCIPYRDYGMQAMHRRGYNCILFRDCTKAIEAHDTLDEELCNKIAVREIERQFGWSALSEDFLEVLAQDPEVNWQWNASVADA